MSGGELRDALNPVPALTLHCPQVPDQATAGASAEGPAPAPRYPEREAQHPRGSTSGGAPSPGFHGSSSTWTSLEHSCDPCPKRPQSLPVIPTQCLACILKSSEMKEEGCTGLLPWWWLLQPSWALLAAEGEAECEWVLDKWAAVALGAGWAEKAGLGGLGPLPLRCPHRSASCPSPSSGTSSLSRACERPWVPRGTLSAPSRSSQPLESSPALATSSSPSRPRMSPTQPPAAGPGLVGRPCLRGRLSLGGRLSSGGRLCPEGRLCPRGRLRGGRLWGEKVQGGRLYLGRRRSPSTAEQGSSVSVARGLKLEQAEEPGAAPASVQFLLPLSLQ